MSERLVSPSGSLAQRVASLLGRPTVAAAPAPSIDSTEGAPIDELVRRIRARRADRETLPSGGPAWSAAAAEERLLTDALRRRSTTITPEGLAWLIGLRPGEPSAPDGSAAAADSGREPAPSTAQRGTATRPRSRPLAPSRPRGTAGQRSRHGAARGPA